MGLPAAPASLSAIADSRDRSYPLSDFGARVHKLYKTADYGFSAGLARDLSYFGSGILAGHEERG